MLTVGVTFYILFQMSHSDNLPKVGIRLGVRVRLGLGLRVDTNLGLRSGLIQP